MKNIYIIPTSQPSKLTLLNEEEVLRILNDLGNKVYENYTRNELMCDFVEQWFEQFKKK